MRKITYIYFNFKTKQKLIFPKVVFFRRFLSIKYPLTSFRFTWKIRSKAKSEYASSSNGILHNRYYLYYLLHLFHR